MILYWLHRLIGYTKKRMDPECDGIKYYPPSGTIMRDPSPTTKHQRRPSKSATTTRISSPAMERQTPTKRIVRNGQLNMSAVYDGSGQGYLIGGMCVELQPFDTDMEISCVDENGWNGTVTVIIDGNGTITLQPEIQLGEDEYVFVGDITCLDYVPYRTTSSSQSTPSDLTSLTSSSASSNSNGNPYLSSAMPSTSNRNKRVIELQFINSNHNNNSRRCN